MSRTSWFLVGIGVGAAVMLLYAPKSGKDMRRQISRTAKDGKKMVVRGANRVYEFGDEAVDKSRRALRRTNKALNTAVHAGKTIATAIM